MTIDTGPFRPSATLSVEPARLGQAAAAFDAAASRVTAMINNAQNGLVARAAMADPVSIAYAEYATANYVEVSGSYVNMFQRYRDELLGVVAALEASQRAYERGESDIAATFG